MPEVFLLGLWVCEKISLRSLAGVETRCWLHAEHAVCEQQCVACFLQQGAHVCVCVCACVWTPDWKRGMGFRALQMLGVERVFWEDSNVQIWKYKENYNVSERLKKRQSSKARGRERERGQRWQGMQRTRGGQGFSFPCPLCVHSRACQSNF